MGQFRRNFEQATQPRFHAERNERCIEGRPEGAELKSRSWQITVPVTCAAMILLRFSIVQAQNIDKLKISAGGYSVFKYDSTIALTSKPVGLGVAFSPEDTLGWE